MHQKPLWLWNPKETSLEIQNRGTSDPQIRHVNVSRKEAPKTLQDHMYDFVFLFSSFQLMVYGVKVRLFLICVYKCPAIKFGNMSCLLNETLFTSS